MDPLLHVAINDMRIDFYAWIEERYVRLLTMGVDINVGINLTVTKDANMKPAIQPMLVGVDAKNVTIRISNTDLLQETPAALEQVFPSLINIATGALGGVVKPIALPAVAGFSLDNDQRVQTARTTSSASTATSSSTPAPLSTGRIRPQTFHARWASTPVAGQRARARRAAGASPARHARHHRGAAVKLALGTSDSATRRRVRLARRRRHGACGRRTPTRSSRTAFLLQGTTRSTALGASSTIGRRSRAHLARRAHRLGPARAHPARSRPEPRRCSPSGGFDIVSDRRAAVRVGLARRAAASSPTKPLSFDRRARAHRGRAPSSCSTPRTSGQHQPSRFDLGDPALPRSTAPSTAGCGCTIGGRTGRRSRARAARMILAVLGPWCYFDVRKGATRRS
jgi:hypothetical protein